MAIEVSAPVTQYLPGVTVRRRKALEEGVMRREVLETIIDLDRKELFGLLREVQGMDPPVEADAIAEPSVIWVR